MRALCQPLVPVLTGLFSFPPYISRPLITGPCVLPDEPAILLREGSRPFPHSFRAISSLLIFTQRLKSHPFDLENICNLSVFSWLLAEARFGLCNPLSHCVKVMWRNTSPEIIQIYGISKPSALAGKDKFISYSSSIKLRSQR